MSNTHTPRHIELGYEYGHLVKGWCFKDYIMDAAVRRDGYETVVVDGVQRVGKSNFSLQTASWAKKASIAFKLNQVDMNEYKKAKARGVTPSEYVNSLPIQPTEQQIWTAVLTDLTFKPSDFVNTLEAVPDDDPLDCLTWDDVNAHFTNTAFRIDPEQYSAIDSTFTVVGTKCRVIIANIPNVGRLAKNIKDNCTFEVYIGKNRIRMMKRIFRLPGLRRMDMNLFKIDVEVPSDFDIYAIPAWAWREYEAKRIKLANEALQILKAVTNMAELEGYIPIFEAVKIAKAEGMKWGVATVQQWISRGVLVGQKVNNQLCVQEDSLRAAIEAEKA